MFKEVSSVYESINGTLFYNFSQSLPEHIKFYYAGRINEQMDFEDSHT